MSEEAWATARTLAAVVRQRQAEAEAATKASKKAIAAAGEASAMLGTVLVPYRQLVAALADNAGLSQGPTLAVALAEAEAVLRSLDEGRPDA